MAFFRSWLRTVIVRRGLARIVEWIRDWLLRLPARERNLDAISLSNCTKLSDNPRIKTVEYTVS